MDFISTNFPEWLVERLRDYSQILQILLVEANALDSTLQQVPEPDLILGMAITFAFIVRQGGNVRNLTAKIMAYWRLIHHFMSLKLGEIIDNLPSNKLRLKMVNIRVLQILEDREL